MDCCSLAVCSWNDTGRAALRLLPKKRCAWPFRTVDGAAGRPLADKLDRDGTTGRLPVIMRAPLNCSRVAATGRTGPVPKRAAFTVDTARATRWSLMRARFEYRSPLCKGGTPPNWFRLMLVMLTFVIFTTLKRLPPPPHHGWKPSHAPTGNHPKPPQPPKPAPKPQPPPQPKNDTYAGAHSGR